MEGVVGAGEAERIACVQGGLLLTEEGAQVGGQGGEVAAVGQRLNGVDLEHRAHGEQVAAFLARHCGHERALLRDEADEAPALELEHCLSGGGAAGVVRLGEVGLDEEVAGFVTAFDDLAGGRRGHSCGDRGGVVGALPGQCQQVIHVATITDAYIDRCIRSRL